MTRTAILRPLQGKTQAACNPLRSPRDRLYRQAKFVPPIRRNGNLYRRPCNPRCPPTLYLPSLRPPRAKGKEVRGLARMHVIRVFGTRGLGCCLGGGVGAEGRREVPVA